MRNFIFTDNGISTFTTKSGVLIFHQNVEFEPPTRSHKLGSKACRVPQSRSSSVDMQYWKRRYQLWSRFDEGIEMDSEAWFEVTPENIAAYISTRMSRKEVIHDCCSGVGGNSIQFALKGMRVIAVDLNAARLNMLRNNARVYGVMERIEYINRDVVDYLNDLSDDRDRYLEAFFISPPWGGHHCRDRQSIHIGQLPVNMNLIIRCALAKFDTIVLHIPRQTDIDDLINTLRNEGVSYVEVDSIYYTEPVRHLKCHLVYIDSSPTNWSILRGPRQYRLRNMVPFLRRDRFAPTYTEALLKITYIGRFILQHLEFEREHGPCVDNFLSVNDWSKISAVLGGHISGRYRPR